MHQKTLIKLITALIFVVVLAVPLFYLKQGIYPLILDKTLFFQAIIEILFALWLALAVSDPKYRPRRTPLFLSLLFFMAVLALTAFLGVDVWRSFFSTDERAFGVFALMHMAAFAIVLSSLKEELPWKWIFAGLLGTSVVVSVLAIGEVFISNLLLEQPSSRPGSTFGNPTFLSGYLLWNIFLGIYFLFDWYRRGGSLARAGSGRGIHDFILRIFFSRPYLISVILLEAAVLIFVAQTRGNILGLAAGLFTLLVLFALRPPGFLLKNNESGRAPRFLRKLLTLRSTYVALVAFIVIGGSFFWATRTHPLWGQIPGISRFQEVSLSSEGLQPRFIALRAAWRGFLENPILGVGPENFNVIFNKYYEPQALRANYQETRFDKPHNFLMEDLATGGVTLTLAHLLFLAFFVWTALKNADKLFGQVVVAATAGYFVSNLFIFNTIGSDLLFYLLVGFIGGANETAPRQVGASPSAGPLRHSASEAGRQDYPPERYSNIPKSYFAIALGASLIFAYAINVRTMQASYNHFWGFIDTARGIDAERSRLEKGINNFRRALRIWHPYRWNFARDFAAAMSELYFYHPEIIPQSAVLEAIGEMEKVAEEHPLDAYNHYALVDMYNQVSDIDPERFLNGAEREGKIALELSPDRQQVYFSLAKTKTLKGDYPAALELVKYGLRLDDQVADAHFYYGLISFATDDDETGYREIKRSLELGREWKNSYEPLTVGNLLADAGRLDDAIGFYEIAVGMRSDDLESKTKLGVAYYFAGRTPEAKEKLQEVAQKFDFRTSSAFEAMKPILDDLMVVY